MTKKQKENLETLKNHYEQEIKNACLNRPDNQKEHLALSGILSGLQQVATILGYKFIKCPNEKEGTSFALKKCSSTKKLCSQYYLHDPLLKKLSF